jgi:hypothetical protein
MIRERIGWVPLTPILIILPSDHVAPDPFAPDPFARNHFAP